MRLPTFLILGAPKCGTTALAQFISSHPNVFVTNPKEPHFFDSNYEMGLENYLKKYYSSWSTEHAAGEATPSYLIVPYVAKRIKECVPNAKLIVLLRNPIERAYSSWWMFRARGMEQLSFEETINYEIEQYAGDDNIESVFTESSVKKNTRRIKAGKEICERAYLCAGHYADHLTRFYQEFPQHNIKVIFSHQLRRNHEKSIRDIWNFIGVDMDEQIPDFNAVNEALGHRAAPLLKTLQGLGLMQFRHLLPNSIMSFAKNKLSNMGSRPKMNAETRKVLLAYFTPHIEKLELLVDEDLSDWKLARDKKDQI